MTDSLSKLHAWLWLVRIYLTKQQTQGVLYLYLKAFSDSAMEALLFPLTIVRFSLNWELPMTPLAGKGKHGLQSNTLALAVETGTEGFASPLSLYLGK